MTDQVRIPIGLQNRDFRFVKIPAGRKFPLEKSWQKGNNHAWNDPALQEHLAKGGNYGVVCGFGGLVVIDADKHEVEEAVRNFLPETFTVRTGGGGLHFYFICVDLDRPIRLKEEKAGDLGDVQYTGKQVVGANSIHPNGNRYEVEWNLPIQEVSAEELRFALRDFLADESEALVQEESTALEGEGIGKEIPITEVVPLDNLKRVGKEFQGGHPTHGSTTGRNFTVNPRKGVWHCFRHGTGGGSLSWLAVQEGIINCSEAVPGALRGDKFARVLEKAGERGLIDKEKRSRLPYHEKGKFVPKYLADDIMADFHFITLKDTDEIYVYGDGVYLPEGETTIREETQRRLGKYSRKHYQIEVVNFIRSATYTPRDKLNENSYKIVVENGVLNLKTLELEPHSPNPPSTIKIPVEYDPSAKCLKIENFLSEVFKKKDVLVAQEFVGYCLLKDHRFHKAVMLTGGGANGKSTFLNLVRRLLGRDNVSSPSLHDLLYNRFAKADLYGKLANIHADIPDYVLKKTGTFKMLTGEDQIYAEKKHRDAFHFDNFAKLLFSANEIPETKDKTRAFFRRWLIIEFPYKFTSNPKDGNKNKDPEILKKITTKIELSGFLNWALQGLERLLKNNRFSTELTVEERAEIWEKMSDPIVAFAEGRLVIKPNVYGIKDEIYNAYARFCYERDTPPLDKNVFSRELPKRFPVDTYRPRINGRQTQCWKGLSLKDNVRVSKDTLVSKDTPTHQKKRGVLYSKDIAVEHDSELSKDIKDVLQHKGKYENNGTNVVDIVYDIESIPDIPAQEKVVDEILRFLKRYGGKTPAEIADELDMQLKNVEKILGALVNAGIVGGDQEKLGGGKIYNIVHDFDLSSSVFNIKKRLWKAFGVRPFKPSELLEHFSDDELERVNNVILKMKENGEIRLVPMESGITVWEFTPEGRRG